MENLPSNNEPINNLEAAAEQYDISLLEEKLVVKRSRRKVGEVVVRKEIETQTLHIPIRREKLIVEKIGVSNEQLTEIDLGSEKVNGIKFNELGNTNDIYQSQSEFVSLDKIQEFLTEITKHSDKSNLKIRLEVITDNPETQQVFSTIFE
ncbi:MAG: DUF2382 domain-containing protein [Cyanobacteria bacterium J06643_13]